MSLNTVSSTPAQDALLRAWIWLSFHRKTRFMLAVALTCFLCQMTNATMALAADDKAPTTALNTYLLPLGNVTDTHGVPVGTYTELPLDYGQGTYIARQIRGVLMRLAWMLYTVVVYGILALCNFVLSLEWVDWVLSPFTLLANTIQGLMDQVGIVGVGIFIAAITIAWGLARGKMGAAILEIAIVALFAGLVSSPIANPSDQIKSWISTSASYGTEAGATAVAGTEAGAKADINPVSGQIVDIAVRDPALMLSFGSTLDGDNCSKIWDDKAKSGTDTEGLRKAVLGCNKDLKPANETDSFDVFAFMAIFWVSTGGLMALICVFLFFLLKDVMLAGLGLVNTVFRVHLAVFPGGGRQAFVNAFLQLIVNVVMVGAYIFLLSLYLWLVGVLHASLGAAVMMIANLIFGLVLLGLAITFWYFKRQGKSVAKKLAAALGGSPMNRAPALKPSGFSQGASQLARTGKNAASQHIKNKITRQVMSKGLQAAAAGATGGASVAAVRMAAAGWFVAGHLAKDRPGAASPEAGAAPTTQSYRPPMSNPLAAISAKNSDTMHDENGAIPMGQNAMAADPQPESNPGQAVALRTPEKLNQPTGDRVPATNTSEPAAIGPRHRDTPTTPPALAPLATGTAQPAAGEPGTKLTTGTAQPEAKPSTKQRSTLPTGQYGNVRVNRNGSTNNVLSGNVVDSLPAGLKAARTWEVPANGTAQSRSRRQATVQTAAYQMNNRTRNHAAERGEI